MIKIAFDIRKCDIFVFIIIDLLSCQKICHWILWHYNDCCRLIQLLFIIVDFPLTTLDLESSYYKWTFWSTNVLCAVSLKGIPYSIRILLQFLFVPSSVQTLAISIDRRLSSLSFQKCDRKQSIVFYYYCYYYHSWAVLYSRTSNINLLLLISE